MNVVAVCPFCGVEILPGADECDQCGQSLTELSLPVPSTRVEEALLTDAIEVLNPKQPLTVEPGTAVGEAVKRMVDEGIGCVIVVQDDLVVGIFSERDAVLKLNVDADKLQSQPISRYMTSNPVTLSADDKIAFALHKMNLGGYRHIPILAGTKLVGVISIRDILDYLTQRIPAV